MRPELREQLLPMGLLIAAIVSGGICWALEGTALVVMLGVTLVLLIAGVVVALRTDSARRDKR